MASSPEWLRQGGALAALVEGFEEREQQVRMAEAVARTLADRSALVVEAGTGVGKTLAYLAPAVERIVQHREVVVVSTNTIALQEQLLGKDLPLLERMFPGEVRATLVKGRGNYVSLRRLQLASERQERLFPEPEVVAELHALEDWATTTRDGSLASIPAKPSARIWESVQSDASNCMGRRCPNYEVCFYQSARREAERSNLLVCNHALFFSDLVLRQRGRGFLPGYDHVILDEAHAIEDVACEAFGISLGSARIHAFLRGLWSPRARRGLLGTLRTKGPGHEVTEAVNAAAEAERAAQGLFAGLRGVAGEELSRRLRTPPRGAVENALSPALVALSAALRRCRDAAERENDALEMASQADRAEEMAGTIDAFMQQSVEGCVYWVEVKQGRGARGVGGGRGATEGRDDVSIHGSVIDVAPILRTALFCPNRGVVLSSATLALGGGDFTHAARRLGCDEPTTLQLDSPFDYRRQCRLIIDVSLAARARGGAGGGDDGPQDPAAMAARVLHHVRATDGGAFVLFTSYQMLRDVAALCEDGFAADQRGFHVHGRDVGRTVLLDRFRADRRSVLFGTATFWQGVDVRGDALRNVIIAKLPFDVPDRPLVEARSEAVEAGGGSAFWEDSLPRAILRLKQGFGRLIRSSTDRGQVVILDPRLRTKRYGRAFLAALPGDMDVEYVGGEEGERAGEGAGEGETPDAPADVQRFIEFE